MASFSLQIKKYKSKKKKSIKKKKKRIKIFF